MAILVEEGDAPDPGFGPLPRQNHWFSADRAVLGKPDLWTYFISMSYGTLTGLETEAYSDVTAPTDLHPHFSLEETGCVQGYKGSYWPIYKYLLHRRPYEMITTASCGGMCAFITHLVPEGSKRLYECAYNARWTYVKKK